MGGLIHLLLVLAVVALVFQLVTGKGRHVSGLEVGDFRVFEEGRLQEVKLFQEDDTPSSADFIDGTSHPERFFPEPPSFSHAAIRSPVHPDLPTDRL